MKQDELTVFWPKGSCGLAGLRAVREALAGHFDGAQQLLPAQQFLRVSPPTKYNSGQVSRPVQSSQEHPAQSETQGSEISHSLKPNGGGEKNDLT